MLSAYHHLLPLPPKGDKARSLAMLFLVLGPLLCGIAALQLGQDANWDLRNYHWYNAYALLDGRHGYDLLPSQTPFFYNPLLDVPVFLLGRLLSGQQLGFVLGLVQGLNFCLLFMIAHAVLIVPKSGRKVLICAVLAALGMAGGGGIAQLGTTFNDNMVSLGLLGSILLVTTTLPYLLTDKPLPALRRAFLYGIPAGLALGLKLTLICFCLGVTLAWLLTGGNFMRRLQLAFAFGCGLTLGLLITQGFWMWHLWSHYQNPLFPYFNNVFGSPFGAPVSARDLQFMPKDAREAVLFPWHFTLNPKRVGEIVWQDWRVLALYALLPVCSLIAVLVGRRQDATLRLAEPLGTRFLLWTAVLSYLAWLGLFSIYRYLIPLEMLAPLLLVLTLGLLPLQTNFKWLAAGALLLIIAAGVRGGDWGRVPWTEKFIQAPVPTVSNPESTMLLMAGFEPYAHVIPSFPAVLRVTRLQSNFAGPRDSGKGINRVIADRIGNYRGDFLLLIPDWQVTHRGLIDDALGFYGLRFIAESCRKFPDNLGYAYALCQVFRQKAE